MWLACATQEEIAEAVGCTVQTASNWSEDFSKSSSAELLEKSPNFTPPIYNVWKKQTKTNAVSHFGNSEVEWLENLLYLYTEPAGIVVDPFAGGGSTVVNWEEDFLKSSSAELLTKSADFNPPIYNVWSKGFSESSEDEFSEFPPGFTPPIYNVWIRFPENCRPWPV